MKKLKFETLLNMVDSIDEYIMNNKSVLLAKNKNKGQFNNKILENCGLAKDTRAATYFSEYYSQGLEVLAICFLIVRKYPDLEEIVTNKKVRYLMAKTDKSKAKYLEVLIKGKI